MTRLLVLTLPLLLLAPVSVVLGAVPPGPQDVQLAVDGSRSIHVDGQAVGLDVDGQACVTLAAGRHPVALWANDHGEERAGVLVVADTRARLEGPIEGLVVSLADCSSP
jgi:hypothetical protein